MKFFVEPLLSIANDNMNKKKYTKQRLCIFAWLRIWCCHFGNLCMNEQLSSRSESTFAMQWYAHSWIWSWYTYSIICWHYMPNHEYWVIREWDRCLHLLWRMNNIHYFIQLCVCASTYPLNLILCFKGTKIYLKAPPDLHRERPEDSTLIFIQSKYFAKAYFT